MEKIYSVGTHVPYDLPSEEGLKWLVYCYEDYDGYSGGGQAVGMLDDGSVKVADLGHCSCYGAFDAWERAVPVTIEEVLRQKDDIHDLDIMEDILVKIRELMNV
jgi:hypothetical protein